MTEQPTSTNNETPEITDDIPQDEATPEPVSDDSAPAAEQPDIDPETPPLAANVTDEELEALRKEAKQNWERWQRALADLDNYKKRVERERVDTYDHATAEIFMAILPIVDDFERASENVPEDLDGNTWVDGTMAVGRKLQRLLEKYEIEAIDPVGKPFNPDEHQGLGVDEDSDVESGHVSMTLQKGYRKGDKILRPALVRVAG